MRMKSHMIYTVAKPWQVTAVTWVRDALACLSVLGLLIPDHFQDNRKDKQINTWYSNLWDKGKGLNTERFKFMILCRSDLERAWMFYICITFKGWNYHRYLKTYIILRIFFSFCKITFSVFCLKLRPEQLVHTDVHAGYVPKVLSWGYWWPGFGHRESQRWYPTASPVSVGDYSQASRGMFN